MSTVRKMAEILQDEEARSSCSNSWVFKFLAQTVGKVLSS